ncbi:MAG: hypothetical protein GY867_02955 [bacterium]|nr:hypothetical protein [bacterium]
MTERLYYKEPGLLEFEARIIESGRQGDHYFSVLDRSAFYPTSGGQLHDTGHLGDVKVVEVVETDSGDVRHITLSPVAHAGSAVSGRVDRARRQRHRRQHTAQHILSAVFAKLHDLDTQSVHLGEEYGAIEFNATALTPEQVEAAEQSANSKVLDALPIEILFVESEEVSQLPLRRPTSRTGTLRIIRIVDCDYVACGGTHCSNTAEVGPIKITAVEKARGRILIKFLSGRQALEDYAVRFTATDSMSRSLTCAVEDLPEKIEKMAGDIRRLKKQVYEARKHLLPARASELATFVHHRDKADYVAVLVKDVDPVLASKLAGMVADLIEGFAVLLIEERLVLGVCEKTDLHAGNMARALAQAKDLKGGGNSRQAQLGGADCKKLEEYVEAILDSL